MSLTSTIGNLTVGGLANELIAQLELEPRDEVAVAKSLAETHVESVSAEQIAIVREAVSEVGDSRRRVVH
jgi:hypothetical protein